MTNEQVKSSLLRYWGTDELKFIAEFQRPKNKDGTFQKLPYGFFVNLRLEDADRTIIYPNRDGIEYNRKVTFRQPLSKGLSDGKFYLIELEPELETKRVPNPFQLKVANFKPVDEYKSPKDFIKYWFYRKGENPEDASTIASQLKLNELELYTHTKRFVFELIQNADDMPRENSEVHIELHLLQNHLLFLHNGKYFDRDDVRAICDAAKSTKSGSVTQTGYKGIGFKSVFTDSFRVYIKSGDYSFKFDKIAPVYKDFWALYEEYYNSKTVQAKREFKTEFTGKESFYTNIDRIPWQIKPLWVERNEFPEELTQSNFSKNYEVAISLEIGESIIQQKDYNGMILGLLKEPRFLLFLRNTKRFKYQQLNAGNTEESIDVSIVENNGILSVCNGDKQIAAYIKHEFIINIENDDFIKAGLNFQRRELEGGKVEFFDTDGRKLENIPEKLGHLKQTVISLSAKVDRSSIEKLTSEESILFNYLPTSDQRFGFPFLVNADFVSKSDREFIQIENKWNHYLFYHIGFRCIEWIARLGSINQTSEGKRHFTYAKTYLNLLPDSLLDEQNEELISINKSFNNGFKEALNTISFILSWNKTLKKCDEVIIDDTLVSSILGPIFFQNVTGSTKSLPLLILSLSDLKKDYLNIERYPAEKLITQLENIENKSLLADVLKKLSIEKYLDFLNWLDKFCEFNSVKNNWVLDLPIIRLKASVISINEALTRNGVLIKTVKSKDVESLSTKLGYEMTEFYLDDYNQLYTYTSQVETYLNKDLKLYERIAANNQLAKLTPAEKNTLLTFLKALDKVGQTKYAETLALFNSKQKHGTLKPLSRLISNSCKNLPVWLTDFVIDTTEEAELSDVFKKHLIQEDELLQKLFCTPTTFVEIATGINAHNINDFYTYLLKLLKANPEETKIDFSAIPCVFIEASSKFVLASAAYWPESIAKLSTSKYTSIKTIIETISTEQLPHFTALQVKAPFALGGKDFKLTDILPKENSFDVLPINDFLDWVQANREEAFLSHFSVSKLNDKYTLAQANGTLLYYTTDETLIAFIKASSINAKLNFFPIELYTKERSKIGLLEGVNFLKFLLDNGQATATFSKFIFQESNTPLSLQYLDGLLVFNIDTNTIYQPEAPEFKILKLVAQHLVEDEEKLKLFKNKITIDSHPLAEKAISDDVRFYKQGAAPVELKTKLKEILSAYKNQTYSISDIIGRFVDFRDDSKLIKIFKSDSRPVSRILKELNELKPSYYSPTQTFFLSYFKSFYPNEDVFKDKVLFTNANSDKPSQFEKEIHEFLDICFKEDSYTGFLAQGIIPAFNPNLLIQENDYALKAEQLPNWLVSWMKQNPKDEAQAFLSKMGVQSIDSAVVQLRKGLTGDTQVNMDTARGGITEPTLLKNTFEWLLTKHKNQGYTPSLLKPLYERAAALKISIGDLPLPLPVDTSCKSYLFYKSTELTQYHLIWEGWESYKSDVWAHLKQLNYIIVDDLLPEGYLNQLKPLKLQVSKEIDKEKVLAGLRDFNASYYRHWPEKGNYVIKIFKGNKLPRKIIYNKQVVKNYFEGQYEKLDNFYVVVENIENAIPHSIRELIPDFFDKLNSWKSDFENNRTERKLSPEEEEAVKKLFDGVVPEEFRKNQNLTALASALVCLDREGYDVFQANKELINTHEYAQLAPVYKNGEEYTIMCRSARLGLLYLTKRAWDRLGNTNVFLYADKGYGESDLFQSKQDVLDVNKENPTDFQIMRIESRANAVDLDRMLQGKFEDASRLWIIFRLKGNEHFDKLFFERYEANNTQSNSAGVRTDDNIGY